MWQRPPHNGSLELLVCVPSLLAALSFYLDEHVKFSLSSTSLYNCYWMHRVVVGLWHKFESSYHPPRRSEVHRRAIDDTYYASLPPGEETIAPFVAAGCEP